MELNKELLKDLYMIDHPSGSEHEMITFILNYCYKIPNVRLEIDHYNNLFITKNTNNPETYPCLIAHMDQVQTNTGRYEIHESNGVIYGLHKLTKTRCGIGADDANGICVALQMLEVIPDLKVIFTVEEEIGAKGAEEVCFNTDFLYNIRYFLQADRRGASDLIVHTNGIDVASEEFVADLKPLMDEYKYKENFGTYTDVGEIVSETGISGVNISCGYMKEHTSNEHCIIADLENCLNFIYSIITTLDPNKKYPIKIDPKYYNYTGYNFDWEPASTAVKDYAEYEGPTEDDSYPKEYNPYSDDIPCNSCREMDCMNCPHMNDF